MTNRPAVLFYCQHSLGMGHLMRSFALADRLAERFRVVLLNGGRLPKLVAAPANIELINLPPLGIDDGNARRCLGLARRDARSSDDDWIDDSNGDGHFILLLAIAVTEGCAPDPSDSVPTPRGWSRPRKRTTDQGRFLTMLTSWSAFTVAGTAPDSHQLPFEPPPPNRSSWAAP